MSLKCYALEVRSKTKSCAAHFDFVRVNLAQLDAMNTRSSGDAVRSVTVSRSLILVAHQPLFLSALLVYDSTVECLCCGFDVGSRNCRLRQDHAQKQKKENNSANVQPMASHPRTFLGQS
jgi:hypothetical protein